MPFFNTAARNVAVMALPTHAKADYRELFRHASCSVLDLLAPFFKCTVFICTIQLQFLFVHLNNLQRAATWG